MKLTLLPNYNNSRTTAYRPSLASADVGVADGTGKSPANFFRFLLHVLCCITSLVLSFRFSRLVFFLFFSTSTLYTSAPVLRATTSTTLTLTETFTFSLPSQPPPPPPAVLSIPNRTRSRVVVSCHGIRICPWPYPNPSEVMQAHRIIDRVQRGQRLQFGVKAPCPLVIVTPTYVRTFYALHLSGLLHSLLLVPYPITRIIIDLAGRA